MDDIKKTKEQLIDELVEIRQATSINKLIEDEKAKTNSVLEGLGVGLIIQDLNYKVIYENKYQQNNVGNHIGEYCYMAYESKDHICEDCPMVLSLQDREVHRTERMIPTAEGNRYYELISSPLINSAGEISGGIKLVKDITGRKQTEIEQLTLKNNLESLWDLVKLQDKDLKTVADFVLEEISKMSKSVYGFYGLLSKDESIMNVYAWSKKVMKDCNIHNEYIAFEIKNAGIWADAVRKRRNILINNYSESFEGKKGIPEGHVALTRILSVPVFSQNKIVAIGAVANKDSDYTAGDVEQLASFLTSAHLIIERKQVEIERERLNAELEIKNNELEQVLNVTSHDLRTPLVNIGGYSTEITKSLEEVLSILQNEDNLSVAKEKISLILESDIGESEKYISKNIVKMDNLLYGLLKLSRLGRQELKKEQLDMNTMMADIAESMTYQVNAIGTKLEMSELPFCIADAIQINQLFSNLIENALKYLDPERSGVINVSGRKENSHSVYCVEDNGIGIAPEHQEKIFKLFYQLEPHRVKGEGMGLTIAKKIVDRISGSIWVESEPGKGSKFFVSIPS